MIVDDFVDDVEYEYYYYEQNPMVNMFVVVNHYWQELLLLIVMMFEKHWDLFEPIDHVLVNVVIEREIYL